MKDLNLLEWFLIYQADVLTILNLHEKAKVDKLLNDSATHMLNEYTPVALVQLELYQKTVGLTDIVMNEHESVKFNIRLKLYNQMLTSMHREMSRIMPLSSNLSPNIDAFWTDRTNNSNAKKMYNAFMENYTKTNSRIDFILKERVDAFDKIILEADVPLATASEHKPQKI